MNTLAVFATSLFYLLVRVIGWGFVGFVGFLILLHIGPYSPAWLWYPLVFAFGYFILSKFFP